MKILVIGAKGFIGSNSTLFFKEKKYTVVEADILNISKNDYYSLQNVSFEEIIKIEKPDLCLNASGAANVQFSYENPVLDYELNVYNVSKILWAIKKHQPNCKFINLSSAAVYGAPKKLPISEKSEIRPLSPYGYHKVASEKLLEEFNVLFGLKTCSVRIFSAFGPRLKKQLFWDFYHKYKSTSSKNVSLFGTGKETRDFIYIHDLLNALELIFEKCDFKASLVNAASGHETTIKEATETWGMLLGGSKKISFSGEEKIGDPKFWKADISILKSYGFEPKYSLKKGLEAYMQWIKKELD